MSNAIPEKYLDLFQKRAFASLGTLMPDGRPQVTPVWCDFDGQHVIFNSARGRQKDRNVRRDPRVALAIIDPDNPYRYLEIRGTVVEITEDGADHHIDKMAKKYLGRRQVSVCQAGRGARDLQNPAGAHYGDGLEGNTSAGRGPSGNVAGCRGQEPRHSNQPFSSITFPRQTSPTVFVEPRTWNFVGSSSVSVGERRGDPSFLVVSWRRVYGSRED